MSDQTFARRFAIVVATVIGLWLTWYLSGLLLLVFASLLVAIIFRTLADGLTRWTPLTWRQKPWIITAAVVLILAVLIGAAWLFGHQVRTQVEQLVERLPRAWSAFEERFGAIIAGERWTDWLERAMPSSSGMLQAMGRTAMTFASSLASLALVFVGGIYLAAQPKIYRQGIVRLIPPAHREAAKTTMARIGAALRSWLIAQLIAMVVVGLLTGLGLWAIGVPSPIALGLLAGLAEFVPIVGPIFAAVPALLMAVPLGWEAVLWTAALFLVIQQIEGNVLMPIVVRRAVSLPPALTLFAVVFFGALFGPIGVLLAAPLAVVAFVTVSELYVKRTLEDPEQAQQEEREPS